MVLPDFLTSKCCPTRILFAPGKCIELPLRTMPERKTRPPTAEKIRLKTVQAVNYEALRAFS
jgi:hypothetical protein